MNKNKSILAMAMVVMSVASCKKEQSATFTANQTKTTSINGIQIVNGMLSFEKAEFYDGFVSRDEKEIMPILAGFEEDAAYLSLNEQRSYAEDETYTPLISSLLNSNLMIHIENKVYRINASSGYVYSIPAEYINDNAAITALKNEDKNNSLISVNSVEEDLWEISGLPEPKSGAGGGCPTVAGYNGTERQLYNDKSHVHKGIACSDNVVEDLIVHTSSRYERYGIYFELSMRGWEIKKSNDNYTCNQIKFEIPTITWKSKNLPAQNVYSINPYPVPGGMKVKVKPYGSSRRLCWFYMNGRVGALKNGQWQYTNYCPVRFNYTP